MESRRRGDRMRLDEARAIVRNAESGALDLDAPEVLREVERAQQALMRARLRGESAGRWSTRRVVVIVGVIAVALWFVGLLVAVLFEWR